MTRLMTSTHRPTTRAAPRHSQQEARCREARQAQRYRAFNKVARSAWLAPRRQHAGVPPLDRWPRHCRHKQFHCTQVSRETPRWPGIIHYQLLSPPLLRLDTARLFDDLRHGRYFAFYMRKARHIRAGRRASYFTLLNDSWKTPRARLSKYHTIDSSIFISRHGFLPARRRAQYANEMTRFRFYHRLRDDADITFSPWRTPLAEHTQTPRHTRLSFAAHEANSCRSSILRDAMGEINTSQRANI